jgi:hypothetical protein
MSAIHEIHVKALTWNHDSKGLFDYESKNVFKKAYKARPINESYLIHRSGCDVGMTLANDSPREKAPRTPLARSVEVEDPNNSPLRAPSDSESYSGVKSLVRVYFKDGSYWMEHPDIATDNRKSLWVVLRDSRQQCVLSSGDMLKMGRYKVRVREAVTDPSGVGYSSKKRYSISSACSHDDAETMDSSPVAADLLAVQESEVCRICYDSGDSSNPLICPCKCSGSMQYIHLRCLRKWMDGRLSVNKGDAATGTTVSYFWRNLDCELCKVTYPTVVDCPTANGLVESVDLYELPKPNSPFVILESNIRVPPSQQSSTGVLFQKGLHIMSLSRSRLSVNVGRGHEADVRISDISVSRCHAHIRLTGDRIVLEDKGSKFGTLIAVNRPIRLDPGVPVSVQSGRTITTVLVKKPTILSMIPACFGGTKAPVNTQAIPMITHESVPPEVRRASLPDSRQLVARASVASTAMIRRSSDAAAGAAPVVQGEEEVEA